MLIYIYNKWNLEVREVKRCANQRNKRRRRTATQSHTVYISKIIFCGGSVWIWPSPCASTSSSSSAPGLDNEGRWGYPGHDAPRKCVYVGFGIAVGMCSVVMCCVNGNEVQVPLQPCRSTFSLVSYLNLRMRNQLILIFAQLSKLQLSRG